MEQRIRNYDARLNSVNNIKKNRDGWMIANAISREGLNTMLQEQMERYNKDLQKQN
jgi:hypothetical protein